MPLISLITLFYISLAEDTTLQSVFDSSGPGNDYDKYVVLEQNMIYTGGVGIYEGNVLIEGNGAVVDLEGGTGIWVYGDDIIPANLDIQYITLMNGGWYGVFYGGLATGNITNCNFINNGYGVQLYDFAEIQIKNSNFVDNLYYGVALVTTTPLCNVNYCNAWGNGEAPWGENCPGWGSIWTPWEPEGEGVIEQNPLFVDIENFDFTLEENSPCIDAGDPSDTDPDGSIRDIGAIRFGSETILGDCNVDGNQNILDIVFMINNCILEDNAECNCGDLNQDNVVNILDVVLLVNTILTI